MKKQYLIEIKTERGGECITIYGDTPARPFIIARNLWNYTRPGYAARQLERLARSWENNGLLVQRVYGTVSDMPTRGNQSNVATTLADYK